MNDEYKDLEADFMAFATEHGMVGVKTKEGLVLDYYDFENIVRVDCIIPEGSVYYENENGEFVSDIIRIDSIEQI